MKNILYILAVTVLLFSCEKEDDVAVADDTKHHLLMQMDGMYGELIELYTDVPLDLNFDGQYNTDMFSEIDCFTSFSLSMANATVTYIPSSGIKYFGLHVPKSMVYSEIEPFSQCFTMANYVYDFDVDTETQELEITWRFEEPEIESGPLTFAKWDDGKLYLEFDKIFFTSEGWQTVKLYVVYLRTHNQ